MVLRDQIEEFVVFPDGSKWFRDIEIGKLYLTVGRDVELSFPITNLSLGLIVLE